MIIDYEFKQQKFGGGQILWVLEEYQDYVTQICDFETARRWRKATSKEAYDLLASLPKPEAEDDPTCDMNAYYCTECETEYKSGEKHDRCIVCGADFTED